MAVYKPNSWGRTRSPKNLAGPPGTEVVALAATTTLLGITASTVGYATENQRYLHVLVEETASGGDENADAIVILWILSRFSKVV